jgi:hypothetical protein
MATHGAGSLKKKNFTKLEAWLSVVEALVALSIILVMATVAFPAFRAHFADAHLVGAGRQFKSQFRLAWSAAVRSGVYTAIRFERRDDGTVWYAVGTLPAFRRRARRERRHQPGRPRTAPGALSPGTRRRRRPTREPIDASRRLEESVVSPCPAGSSRSSWRSGSAA